jgi:Ca2+-binding EF-hand superfamily protein
VSVDIALSSIRVNTEVVMVNSISGASMLPSMTRIQRPEPLKAAETLITNLDTQKKGYLEVADVQAAFEQVSANSTTAVQDAKQVFSAFDGNGDGQATAEEIAGALQNLADSSQFAQGMNAGAGGGPGMGGPGGPGGAGGPPPPPPPQAESSDSTTAVTLLDPNDTNGDGVVSAAESLTATLAASQTVTASTATTSATTTATASTTATAPAAVSNVEMTGSRSSGSDALQQRIMRLMDAYGLAQPAQQQSRAGIASTYQTGLSLMA